MQKRIILGMLIMSLLSVFAADRRFFEREEKIGIVPSKKENSFFLFEGYKSMRKSAQDNKKAVLGGGVGVGMVSGYATSEFIQRFNANKDLPSEVIKKNKYELAAGLTFLGGLLGAVSVVGFFCKQAGKKEVILEGEKRGIEIGRKEELLKRIQEYRDELEAIEEEDLTPDAKNATKSRVMKFLNKEEEAYKNIEEKTINASEMST